MLTLRAIFLWAFVFFSTGCLWCGDASKKNVVTLCQIPVPHGLQDASFTVVYKFSASKSGKPVNITKVLNDFLDDEPFVSCIEHWNLPSVRGSGTATFVRKPAEGGWIEISIFSKGFNKSVRYH